MGAEIVQVASRVDHCQYRAVTTDRNARARSGPIDGPEWIALLPPHRPKSVLSALGLVAPNDASDRQLCERGRTG